MRGLILIAMICTFAFLGLGVVYVVIMALDNVFPEKIDTNNNTVGNVVNVFEVENLTNTSDLNGSDSNVSVLFREENYSFEEKSEDVLLSTSNRRLNQDESIVDVFGRYATIKYFPVFLGNWSEDFLSYEQKIEFPETFILGIFYNDDYMDGNRTEGFQFENNDLILNYSINFGKDFSWDDLEDSNIFMFGRPYYVVDADYDSLGVDFFEFPYVFDLHQNEVLNLNCPVNISVNFSIVLVSQNKVILSINDVEKEFSSGQIYRGENFVFLVKEIISSPNLENSFVRIVFAPKEIKFKGLAIEYNDEFVDGYDISFLTEGEDDLEGMVISWRAVGLTFLTKEDTIKNQFFDNLEFVLSDKKQWGSEYYYELDLKTKSYDII